MTLDYKICCSTLMFTVIHSYALQGALPHGNDISGLRHSPKYGIDFLSSESV